MDSYIPLVQACVDKQLELVGSHITQETAKHLGITLTNDHEVAACQGGCKETLKKYIQTFEKFGGNLGKEIIMETLAAFKTPVS